MARRRGTAISRIAYEQRGRDRGAPPASLALPRAQATLLRSLGCEQAQGYYFSRPQPEAAFRALLPLQSPAKTQV